MVQYVVKYVSDTDAYFCFQQPSDPAARANIRRELEKCIEKSNGYALLTIQPPKRPRTTGANSQNHHLNGHILQICNSTGNSYDAVKNEVKRIAVEEMNYPYELVNGHIQPQGESESSVEECALLIEASHVLAADLGIILIEA